MSRMTIALIPEQQALLENEQIGWLTTVRGDQPQSSPVWFLFGDGAIWMRSRPGTGKLRNIGSNDRVAFHLDTANGGHVVTIEGRAAVVDDLPDALREPYFAKYDESIRNDLRMDHEGFAQDYSVTVRISPEKLRGW